MPERFASSWRTVLGRNGRCGLGEQEFTESRLGVFKSNAIAREVFLPLPCGCCPNMLALSYFSRVMSVCCHATCNGAHELTSEGLSRLSVNSFYKLLCMVSLHSNRKVKMSYLNTRAAMRLPKHRTPPSLPPSLSPALLSLPPFSSPPPPSLKLHKGLEKKHDCFSLGSS